MGECQETFHKNNGLHDNFREYHSAEGVTAEIYV